MQTKSVVCQLFLIISLSIAGSCQAQSSQNDKSQSGQTKETRNVTSFSALDLAVSANVLLKQGAETSLILEGNADDLEKIVTEVSGSSLKIKTRPGSWNVGRITVYLTMSNIESLNISGSGNIKSETAIKSDLLKLSISGSGKINIPDLSANEVTSTISGSGDIVYSGNGAGKSSSMTITGSGNINAEGFNSNDANVRVTGSGNCKVLANEKLDVIITGSGNVYYKGKAIVDAKVTGSGKIQHL